MKFVICNHHCELISLTLQFPVNGMFDFIGVLSVDTELTEFNGKGKNEGGTAICVDDAFMSEYIAHNPPASMVPRLHCCSWPVLEYFPLFRYVGVLHVLQLVNDLAKQGRHLNDDAMAQLLEYNVAVTDDANRNVIDYFNLILGN